MVDDNSNSNSAVEAVVVDGMGDRKIPFKTIESIVKKYVRFFCSDQDLDDEYFAEEETTPLIEATKQNDETTVFMLLLEDRFQTIRTRHARATQSHIGGGDGNNDDDDDNVSVSTPPIPVVGVSFDGVATPTEESNHNDDINIGTSSTSGMVNSKDDMGMTALHVACAEGNVSIATLLLDHGANILEADWNGETALHFGCKHGQKDIVKFILNKYSSNSSNGNSDGISAGGGDVDDDDQSIDAADVHKSDSGNISESSSSLLFTKIINKVQWHGHTPLHHAAAKGHRSIVSLLIQYGAELNVKDKDGRTPLHLASRYGHHTTVQFLLDEGIDTTIGTTKRGHTAMHMAIEKGHDSVVGSLIPTTPRSMKASMIKLAMERGHESIVGLLNESVSLMPAPPDL